MKDILTIFGAILISSITFTSCGGSSVKIKVSELETPCEHVDAMQKVFDDVITLAEKTERKGWDDLENETRLEFQTLMDKVSEIDENCAKKKYVATNYEECDSFVKLKAYKDKLPMYFIFKTVRIENGIMDSL